MTFKQRLPYFLGGLTIGIIIVVFFLGKKDTSFDYGPNARLLKNIQTKQLLYSNTVESQLTTKEIDTTTIAAILKNGDADMWNKVKQDSCIVYAISGKKELKNITITVKNCDSTATIEKVSLN